MPWTHGQVCPNPRKTPPPCCRMGVTGPRRERPPLTGLTFGEENLELLLPGWKRSEGKHVSLATQVSILETSVIRQFLHVDGSAPVCSFTFGAHSCGLECLSLTLALNVGNLGLWKYKSVRVRQICVRSWLQLNGGMILARSPFFQSFNFIIHVDF